MDTIKLLLDAGASVSLARVRAAPPLFRRAAPVLVTLGMPCCLLVQTSDGATPLHLAAIMNHVPALELLIARGAPVDQRVRVHVHSFAVAVCCCL